MKLSIYSQSHSKTKQPSPSRLKNSNLQTQNIYPQEKDRPFFSNCPSFVFGICNDQNHRISTQQNEVIENGEEQNNALKCRRDLVRRQNIASQNNRKQKISLSLKQNSSKNSTSKKKTNIRESNKCYSENRKDYPFDQMQNNNINFLTPKRKVELGKYSKVKTETIQPQKSAEKNQPKLKDSLKPSTNVLTPSRASLKQSVNSIFKKPKLTLSNNFKSLISQQNLNLQPSADESFVVLKKVETALASHQVFIEQSLMTEKLMNIYGESGSFLKQPSSNIVYYNQVMNNEAIWKHPVLSKDNLNKQTKNPQKNTSILRGLDDHQQHYNHYEAQSSKVEVREKFIERKHLGQYAKTIKTFNESEQKQDFQSVVLERGFPPATHLPTIIRLRGSIKDCPSQSEVIKRQYSSFGEDPSFNVTRNRQYISYPIQQGSFDSQKQK